ncbi:DUF1311 domain-containing protein [Acidobacteria bacterium AB60]|nr:DUF1311 domain-containing protein [Acidobacteria bacterium AB60]
MPGSPIHPQITMELPMRVSLGLISSAFFLLSAHTHPQQNSSPHKVLTPEQKAYQQRYQTWFARHQQLQSQAKDIFDRETVHEKAGDCTSASTTLDFNQCFGKLSDNAEESLKEFESVIHELLVPPPQPPGVSPPTHGPAGPSLSSTQLIAEFDNVENSWRQYRETACTAAYHQFDGGTGGRSFQAQCDLTLIRNHLRELDIIYGIALHN